MSTLTLLQRHLIQDDLLPILLVAGLALALTTTFIYAYAAFGDALFAPFLR